jgi:hypothetical protein
MSEGPGDSRARNVDPFEAPDDYAEQWRGRRLGVFLVSLGLIALVAILFIFAF